LIRALLALTVFLAGGAVMVAEILGVRLISPVFGTGLHVWAALISVALVALAAGGFVGGRVADRHPRFAPFFLVVAGAGLGILALPLYAPVLIPAFEPAGYRLGALLAATATFLPPLFLLGCVPPFAVRLTATAVSSVGRTAGRLYALGTLGSVAGTLATGFLFAPVLEIDVILRGLGLLLVLPGVLGLLAGRRLRTPAAGAVLAVGLLLVPAPRGPAPFGELLFRADSPHQRVEVVDREDERWLFLDGCVHTRMALRGEGAVHRGYVRLFGFLPAYRPEARSLLVLGLGGGAVLDLLYAEDYEVTAVELDPVVVDAAREHFGTLSGEEVIRVEDVRTFVRRAEGAWDLVVLDVCGSDLMPEHLVTVEFFREARRVVSPGGVLALNSIGPNDGPTLASLHRTLREVFPVVKALATNPGGPFTNVVFFVSDRPLSPSSSIFEAEEEAAAVDLEEGIVLTDQRNPINFWNAAWAREVRRTRRERY
jgi:spermidine synthase